MKEINIYLKVVPTNLTRGMYVAIIKSDDGTRYELTNEVEEKTINRIIILALAEIIDLIGEPSVLNIYLQSNIGFLYLFNDSEWNNRDVGDILLRAIRSKGHITNFNDYSGSDNFIEIKNELYSTIRKHKRDNNNFQTKDGGMFLFKFNSQNKDINLFIRGSCKYYIEDRPGEFFSLITQDGKDDIELHGFNYNTTEYEMILMGLRESIKKLPNSCNINFYTHADVGLRGYLKGNTGKNTAIANEVIEMIKSKCCGFKYNISQFMQSELKSKSKKNKIEVY